MLKIENLHFSYGDNKILENVNYTLENGEFTFLIGKSGAGKSTFFQLLYLNQFPQQGSITIDEFSTDKIKTSQIPLLRRRIGVVFQDFKLLDDRTVYENLEFVLRVTGNTGKEIKKKIFNSLSDVGLTHKQKFYPGELSGGEQQRVAIARALINEPSIIIADEPTGNLDPDTTLDIMKIFEKINNRGTAVLFATHNYGLVKNVNAKIIKLENGKLVKVVLKKKSS